MLRPYTVKDAAALLAEHVDTFARHYDARVAAGMPASLTDRGRKKFDRGSFDAWLTRFHPAAPRVRPANDQRAPVTPHGEAQWAAALDDRYGGAP